MNAKTTIAMRARDDMPQLRQTVDAVLRQPVQFEWIAFDNASKDGSREVLDRYAGRVFHVAEGCYVPGRVLNQAMQASSTEIVVFLNADCEPVDERWLERLLAPFHDPRVGASFSKQLPRPACRPLAALDTKAAYGDSSQGSSQRNGFSMASCAVRRSVWEAIPFSETLGYSEDIAWSLQVRASGFEVRYVPDACVYHSHNYSNGQWGKRQYGEGKAEALIFTWSPWQRSFLRYSLLPALKQVARDVAYCVSTGMWSGFADIPGYRWAQLTGRREGFLAGLRELDMLSERITEGDML